jgi:hypothetical protein
MPGLGYDEVARALVDKKQFTGSLRGVQRRKKP